MKLWMNKLADSLFPRDCPVCGEIVVPRGARICRDCMRRFSFVQKPVCEKCGKQILSAGQRVCYDCSRRARPYEKGFSLLNYDAVSQKCMVRIKYKNMREDIGLFVRLSEARLGKELRALQADYLVPVPIHSSRRRQRGYNQAELLAEGLSQRLGIPVGRDFLIRSRKTAAQKELGPEERLRNLSEAFQCGQIPQDAGSVILVDDIYTTGATAEACTLALQAGGVGKVYVFCLCSGGEI